jgi:DNA end-binding protein Ku
MAPRANWKGYLKLSLVSCAVALYPATTTAARTRFNIINKQTGNRVRYEVVDAETGDPVEDEDRVNGYKEGNKYILLEDEELERVALESTHTIEIEAFIPAEEVDRIYLDESFYIVPTDEVAQEPFAVIRDAMRKEALVGLARVVLYRRERLLMLEPRGRGLLATALRYNTEVRDADTYFEDIDKVRVPADMLKLATHILDSKKAHFDPDQFEDRYEDALKALIKAKRGGKELPEPEEPRPSNVINLMDALRRSVETEGGGKSSNRDKSRKRAAPKKTRAGGKARRKPARRSPARKAS